MQMIETCAADQMTRKINLAKRCLKGLVPTGREELREVETAYYRATWECTVNCPHRHISRPERVGVRRHKHIHIRTIPFVQFYIPGTTFQMWIRKDLIAT